MQMKPRMLVISHVLPFPGEAGQQQRVANTLRALRESFEVDFLTCAPQDRIADVTAALAVWCDRPIVMQSRMSSVAARYLHAVIARAFALLTGLKPSNYHIGILDYSGRRIRASINPRDYAFVLYEYWHAAASTRVFQAVGIPRVLDMHDVLLHSYLEHLKRMHLLPRWWKRHAISQYRRREEESWMRFDIIVAINRAEGDHVQRVLKHPPPVIYAAMGVDMSKWSWDGETEQPHRIAFYGGLANPNNQRDARICHDAVMPAVWMRHPDVQLWLVGSKPPAGLKQLEADPRVKVPGFVKDIRPLLGGMSMMLCPFEGRFGFRSRIVEALALGVPVIASPDAVHGMDFESGTGVFIAESNAQMAGICMDLLDNPAELERQRTLAREVAVRLYSFERTYGRMVEEIRQRLDVRNGTHAEVPASA